MGNRSRSKSARLRGSSSRLQPLYAGDLSAGTVVPYRGGATPTFTRASTTVVIDQDGIQRTLLSGEIGYPSMRRVYNLCPTPSTTLAPAANKTITLAFASTVIFSMGAGTGTATFSGTGGATGTLVADANNRTFAIKSVTAGTFIVTASVANLVDLQFEDVTGQVIQQPAEYVSVGVLSSPFHGSFVDGVKCFPYLNGNTVTGNVVTAGVGANINDVKWVYLNGVTGTYLSTLDSAANSITGDISYSCQVAAADYTPAAEATLGGKTGNAGNRSWRLILGTTGLLTFQYSTNGTALIDAQSTIAISTVATDTTQMHVAITFDSDNGAAGSSARFYYSLDDVTWTQLGATVTAAGVVTLFDSTANFEVGSYATGTSVATGNLYRARLWNTLNYTTATPAVDCNPSLWTSGSTFPSATGETWALNGSARIVAPRLSGYQHELAATNLLLHNSALDNAAWVKTGCTISATKVVGANGTLTAQKIEETAVTSTHRVVQNLVKAASATLYVGSCELKRQERSWALLLGSNLAETAYVGRFVNLETGALGTAIQAGAYVATSPMVVTPLANGVWRVALPFTTDAAAETSFYVYAASADNVVSYLGVLGSGISCESIQLETGAQATSPIATTTVAVTRAQDVLGYTIPAISGPVTIVATFTPRWGVTGSSGSAIWLYDGVNSYHELHYNATVNFVATAVNGGVSQANFAAGGVPVAGTEYRFAYSANTNDFRACVNGGAITSDVSGSVPSGLTTIRIGGNGLAAGGASIDVKSWAIYPRSVNSSQLVKL